MNLYNDNNEIVLQRLEEEGEKFDLIYADMIYENKNLYWMTLAIKLLANNGVFIVQTDWHTNYLVRTVGEAFHLNFVNHLVWKNEWGNHPKRKFHQCYDDIIIFSNSENYKFYPDRVQVPKVTKNKGLNPSGRETKTATAWIDDICLTTTSKERIKLGDHLIPWQKPIGLMARLGLAFTDEGDKVLDPFMGSGTLGVWCNQNKRQYTGIEVDRDIYVLAMNRIYHA